MKIFRLDPNYPEYYDRDQRHFKIDLILIDNSEAFIKSSETGDCEKISNMVLGHVMDTEQIKNQLNYYNDKILALESILAAK